jgi:acetyl/propionyl-CoA carboxylase alpha subunit
MIRYNIAGLATNVNFLMDLAANPEFVAGSVGTEFIPRHYEQV